MLDADQNWNEYSYFLVVSIMTFAAIAATYLYYRRQLLGSDDEENQSLQTEKQTEIGSVKEGLLLRSTDAVISSPETIFTDEDVLEEVNVGGEKPIFFSGGILRSIPPDKNDDLDTSPSASLIDLADCTDAEDNTPSVKKETASIFSNYLSTVVEDEELDIEESIQNELNIQCCSLNSKYMNSESKITMLNECVMKESVNENQDRELGEKGDRINNNCIQFIQGEPEVNELKSIFMEECPPNSNQDENKLEREIVPVEYSVQEKELINYLNPKDNYVCLKGSNSEIKQFNEKEDENHFSMKTEILQLHKETEGSTMDNTSHRHVCYQSGEIEIKDKEPFGKNDYIETYECMNNIENKESPKVESQINCRLELESFSVEGNVTHDEEISNREATTQNEGSKSQFNTDLNPSEELLTHVNDAEEQNLEGSVGLSTNDSSFNNTDVNMKDKRNVDRKSEISVLDRLLMKDKNTLNQTNNPKLLSCYVVNSDNIFVEQSCIELQNTTEMYSQHQVFTKKSNYHIINKTKGMGDRENTCLKIKPEQTKADGVSLNEEIYDSFDKPITKSNFFFETIDDKSFKSQSNGKECNLINTLDRRCELQNVFSVNNTGEDANESRIDTKRTNSLLIGHHRDVKEHTNDEYHPHELSKFQSSLNHVDGSGNTKQTNTHITEDHSGKKTSNINSAEEELDNTELSNISLISSNKNELTSELDSQNMGQILSMLFESDKFPMEGIDILGGKITISEDGEYAVIDIEGSRKEYKIDRKKLFERKDFREKVKNTHDLCTLFQELEKLDVVDETTNNRDSLLKRLSIKPGQNDDSESTIENIDKITDEFKIAPISENLDYTEANMGIDSSFSNNNSIVSDSEEILLPLQKTIQRERPDDLTITLNNSESCNDNTQDLSDDKTLNQPVPRTFDKQSVKDLSINTTNPDELYSNRISVENSHKTNDDMSENNQVVTLNSEVMRSNGESSHKDEKNTNNEFLEQPSLTNNGQPVGQNTDIPTNQEGQLGLPIVTLTGYVSIESDITNDDENVDVKAVNNADDHNTTYRINILDTCHEETYKEIVHEKSTNELLADLKDLLNTEETEISKSLENLLSIDNLDTDGNVYELDGENEIEPETPTEISELIEYEKYLAEHLKRDNTSITTEENSGTKTNQLNDVTYKSKWNLDLQFSPDKVIFLSPAYDNISFQLKSKSLDNLFKRKSELDVRPRSSSMEGHVKKQTLILSANIDNSSPKIKETNLDQLIESLRNEHGSRDVLLAVNTRSPPAFNSSQMEFHFDDTASETDIDGDWFEETNIDFKDTSSNLVQCKGKDQMTLDEIVLVKKSEQESTPWDTHGEGQKVDDIPKEPPSSPFDDNFADFNTLIDAANEEKEMLQTKDETPGDVDGENEEKGKYRISEERTNYEASVTVSDNKTSTVLHNDESYPNNASLVHPGKQHLLDKFAESLLTKSCLEEPAVESKSESRDLLEPAEEREPEPRDLVEPSAEREPESRDLVQPAAEREPESRDLVEPLAEREPDSRDLVEPAAEREPESRDLVEPAVDREPESHDLIEPSEEKVSESHRLKETAVVREPESHDLVEPVLEREPALRDLVESVEEKKSESRNPCLTISTDDIQLKTQNEENAKRNEEVSLNFEVENDYKESSINKEFTSTLSDGKSTEHKESHEIELTTASGSNHDRSVNKDDNAVQVVDENEPQGNVFEKYTSSSPISLENEINISSSPLSDVSEDRCDSDEPFPDEYLSASTTAIDDCQNGNQEIDHIEVKRSLELALAVITEESESDSLQYSHPIIVHDQTTEGDIKDALINVQNTSTERVTPRILVTLHDPLDPAVSTVSSDSSQVEADDPTNDLSDVTRYDSEKHSFGNHFSYQSAVKDLVIIEDRIVESDIGILEEVGSSVLPLDASTPREEPVAKTTDVELNPDYFEDDSRESVRSEDYSLVDSELTTSTDIVKLAKISMQITPRLDDIKSAPSTPYAKRKEKILEHKALTKSNSWQFKTDYSLSSSSQFLISSIENDMIDEPELYEPDDNPFEEIVTVRSNLKRVAVQQLCNSDDSLLGSQYLEQSPANNPIVRKKYPSESILSDYALSKQLNLKVDRNKEKLVSKSLHNIFNGDHFETDIDEVDEEELREVFESPSLIEKSHAVQVTNVDEMLSSMEDGLNRRYSRRFVIISKSEKQCLDKSFSDKPPSPITFIDVGDDNVFDAAVKTNQMDSSDGFQEEMESKSLPSTSTITNLEAKAKEEPVQVACKATVELLPLSRLDDTNANKDVQKSAKMEDEQMVTTDIQSSTEYKHSEIHFFDDVEKTFEQNVSGPTKNNRDSWDVFDSSPQHKSYDKKNSVEYGVLKRTTTEMRTLSKHHSWNILDLKPDNDDSIELFVAYTPDENNITEINKRDSSDISYLFEKYQREREAIKRMSEDKNLDSFSDFSEISSISDLSSPRDSRDDLWIKDITKMNDSDLSQDSTLKYNQQSSFLSMFQKSPSNPTDTYPSPITAPITESNAQSERINGVTSPVEISALPSPTTPTFVPEMCTFNDDDLSNMVIAKAASAVRKRRRGGRNREDQIKRTDSEIKSEIKTSDSGISDSSNNLSPREQRELYNFEKCQSKPIDTKTIENARDLHIPEFGKCPLPTNLELVSLSVQNLSRHNSTENRQSVSNLSWKSSTSTLQSNDSSDVRKDMNNANNIDLKRESRDIEVNKRSTLLSHTQFGRQYSFEDVETCDTEEFLSESSVISDSYFENYSNGDDENFIYPSIHLYSNNNNTNIVTKYHDDSDSSDDNSFSTEDYNNIYANLKANENERTVYCGNPPCSKQQVLVGNARSMFTSCPSCFTCYCSRECRRIHWQEHKRMCFYGRVSYYIRSIIRRCDKEPGLNACLSSLAVESSGVLGRGCLMVNFESPTDAKLSLVSKNISLSTSPVFNSMENLQEHGGNNRHSRLLIRTLQDYDMEQEFVVNISIVIGNSKPNSTRKRKCTVVRCARISIIQPKNSIYGDSLSSYVIRSFTLPEIIGSDAITDIETRRYYCREVSYGLRRCGVRLKTDYPDAYQKVSSYVEQEVSFLPLVLYGQKDGKNYKCILYPGRVNKSEEAHGEGVLV